MLNQLKAGKLSSSEAQAMISSINALRGIYADIKAGEELEKIRELLASMSGGQLQLEEGNGCVNLMLDGKGEEDKWVQSGR